MVAVCGNVCYYHGVVTGAMVRRQWPEGEPSLGLSVSGRTANLFLRLVQESAAVCETGSRGRSAVEEQHMHLDHIVERKYRSKNQQQIVLLIYARPVAQPNYKRGT